MVEPAKNRQTIASGQAAGATSRRTVRVSDTSSSSSGMQRRHRHRHLLGMRAGHERPAEQDQPGERQVDQPRPVDVGAVRPVHLVLAQVEPVLPGEQRAHLADAHIVVGVGEDEAGDVVPAGVDQPGRVEQPDDDDQQAPAPVDEFH